MERPFICKCLTAEYEEEKSVLRGPVHIQFDIGKEQLFHVDIEQAVIRSIKISTDSDVSIFDLNTVLSKIERLLMLLDGRFIQMKEMKFSESDVFSNDSLIPCAQNLIAQRSSYFCSADFCKNASYRLIDFENVFTPDLFSKWDDLLDELGVVHQMFLYSVSDSKITIDVKCAFLVELAEPIVEVVKERTYYFASSEPSSRGTTLKNCLDALIIKYGKEIFNKELSSSQYNQFLNVLVNSRVNIMHVKRNQRKPALNGKQSCLYAQKLSLLYRKILFELLQIALLFLVFHIVLEMDLQQDKLLSLFYYYLLLLDLLLEGLILFPDILPKHKNFLNLLLHIYFVLAYSTSYLPYLICIISFIFILVNNCLALLLKI